MAKLTRSLKVKLVAFGFGILMVTGIFGMLLFVIISYESTSLRQKGITFIGLMIVVGLQWWLAESIEKDLGELENKKKKEQ